MCDSLKPRELEIIEKYGFLPGVELAEKTGVVFQDVDITYTGIPAQHTRVRLGLDYQGVEVPEGTEAIRLINLEDGRQVVQYEHRQQWIGNVGFGHFKQEIKSVQDRIELTDLMK